MPRAQWTRWTSKKPLTYISLRALSNRWVTYPTCRPTCRVDREDVGDRKSDRSEPVNDEPVGVSSELSIVREPRVGAFNGPSRPEGPVPSPPKGALWWDPSTETPDRSNPMISS